MRFFGGLIISAKHLALDVFLRIPVLQIILSNEWQERIKYWSRVRAAEIGKGSYRSCRWIEEGVFIDRTSIKMCCMSNIGNKSSVLSGLDGINKPGEVIIQSRRYLRTANQTDNAPCEGCYALREQDWEAKSYLGFVAVSGFLHCNLSCSYCVSYEDNPSDRGGAVLEQFKHWYAEGLMKPGLSSIDMGGGESTLHREFEEIADFAFENGLNMVVYTNANFVSKALAKGVSKNLARVIVSVDAGTAETYKRIKGRDMLDRVWANITEYVSVRRNRVSAKYIVMESNRSCYEIDQFFERGKAAGVTHFIAAANSFQNSTYDGNLPTETKHALAYIIKRGLELGQANTAELFTAQLEREVLDLTKLSFEELRASISGSNKLGPLELSFSDGHTFLDRAKSLISKGDNFSILLSSPQGRDMLPERIQEAISTALLRRASVAYRENFSASGVVAVDITF